MAKVKTQYVCQGCGAIAVQWQGQCHECQAWDTLVAEAPAVAQLKPASTTALSTERVSLAGVHLKETPRIHTGLTEFDHVLGGGLVADSVVLIGGDPGVGKSTVLLQVCATLSAQYRCLYVSGEESIQQLAMRSRRLSLPVDQMTCLAETRVEHIIAHALEYRADIVVIDSVQTMVVDTIQSVPGSVSQLREGTNRWVNFAKGQGVAVFLVGHVTKEGTLAGPRLLEHMVDVVLYFEGRNDHRYRVIRAVKNRFGAINEIGLFAMTEQGLKEVSQPSALFLSGYQHAVAGSTVLVTWEGSRPLLVEVQALVDGSHAPNPRRVALGLEQNRLAMLLAVLHRHAGVATYDQDVFINVVGGLKITETSADLALLLSVVSSLRDQPWPSDCVVFGEVGLSGEIRPVPYGVERLKEAYKHGFKTAIVPIANRPKSGVGDMVIHGVKRLEDAIACLISN